MSHTMLRSGLTSPAHAFMTRPASILKRPAALPLSPTVLPFQASFSVVVSPSTKSPHVQFKNTPSLLATFSSEAYDRAPIKVSPNPLALPERGSRFFSPTVDNFTLAPPPPPKAAALQRLQSILKASQQCASPAITDFVDPRSPAAAAASFQQIRFSSFVAPAREQKSMSVYPRSPFPSAPASEAETPTLEVLRTNSEEAVEPRTRSQETPSRPVRAPVAPSPLKASFSTQGLQRSHRPAPLVLEQPDSSSSLSNAFWASMTLEAETPMVTALEYPASAAMEDIDLKSPTPGLMFGGQDGSVWSPSVVASPVVKRPLAARETLLRSALMSPAKAAFAKPVAKPMKHVVVASPSPNDPFAAFPSFAAALSMDTGSVSYPPRVVRL